MRRLAALFAGLLFWAGVAAAQDCPSVPLPGSAQLKKLEAEATDRGMLWRIRRDGHESYLYGSIHIGRPAWLFPGPALREAWARTEVLALELDPFDPQTLQALRSLPDLALDLRNERRLQAQIQAACLTEQQLAGLHPLLKLATLASLSGRGDGLDPGYSQEMALLGRARGEGRAVHALESAAEQMAALVPADEATARRELALGLDQLEKGRVRPLLLGLAEAWERGDLAALTRLEPPCRCADDEVEKLQLQRLNEGRNDALARRIAELHASGKRAFVAVGALHMSGSKALPDLLRQQGFEVEALLPKPRQP
ncbi:TraB/GumN family protein [Pelomonas sp. SE-A7]|uniref:TraB/GumN family protein n=1 Tax=Pelomonas sp. SE-A7 TaxID=3054953 RepID=UPI00259CEE86|nr:TraB/GumN family protein [Pelomonas sp. SE-A7]MDM4768237.1 TraB/GumN family protein [Pelomonas sp. SE-A7]